MLSNSVKQFLKQISITTRLTLYYAAAAFVLLLMVSVFFYSEMVNVLHHNDRQFVSDEAIIISNLLKNHEDNIATLRHEVIHVPHVLRSSTKYFVRVIDTDNKLSMETAGTSKELAVLPFLKITAFAQPQTMYWYSPDGIKYLLIKMATTDTLMQKTWQVQVALDVSYHHYWLVQHRSIILFILSGGEIAAIFFGYLVARHGLRRMRDLLQTTKNITAQSLHQRINVQSWPKELRELGQAFNAMLNRIETAFENMTQFSADLAHELRTPVNNMLGVTEIALSHHQRNPEYCSLLESNIEELQRISKITENILFLAHTENPQLDLKKEVLDLEKELALVSEYYRALADDKNIKINIVGNAKVYANQLMLRRALSNILSNALKYSAGDIDCSIINAGHLVELAVSDKGMGIPADDLPKIFNRFYRVTHVDAPRQSGNGLGLAIVKSIMKLHDGHIHINSIFGEGTLVTLCFINQTS